MSARSGFSRPAAISGSRIVPAGEDGDARAVAVEATPPRRRTSERATSAVMPPILSDASCGRARRSQTRSTTVHGARSRRSTSSSRRSPALVSGRPGPRDRALPRAHAREAAAAGGRGRGRQDRGGEGGRRALGARLIRLQCYEGLDVAHAVYEWNYPRQLLHIRAAQEGTVDEDRAVRPRVPDPPPAARGDRDRRAGRAADRRDRPRRRGVRGVPARGALRLPDHHPGARHDHGDAAARTWS